MTRINELYKCRNCGNIVSIFHSANGTVHCCGKEMTILKANTQDGATEKHIPVVEKKEEVPVWFNKEHDVDTASDEDVEELDKLLNELV